jgi:Ca2+-binding EF-hand superfamily protein
VEIGEDLSEQDLQDMLARADSNKDGLVSAEEFY